MRFAHAAGHRAPACPGGTNDSTNGIDERHRHTQRPGVNCGQPAHDVLGPTDPTATSTDHATTAATATTAIDERYWHALVHQSYDGTDYPEYILMQIIPEKIKVDPSSPAPANWRIFALKRDCGRLRDRRTS